MPSYQWLPTSAAPIESLVPWYVDENGVPNYTDGPTLVVTEQRVEVNNQGLSTGRVVETRVRYVDGAVVDSSFIVQGEGLSGLVGFYPPGVVPPAVAAMSRGVREQVQAKLVAKKTELREHKSDGAGE